MSNSGQRRSTRAVVSASDPERVTIRSTGIEKASNVVGPSPVDSGTASKRRLSLSSPDGVDAVGPHSKRSKPTSISVIEHVPAAATDSSPVLALAGSTSLANLAVSVGIQPEGDGTDDTLSLQAGDSTTPTDWASSPVEPSADVHHPLFHGADHVPVETLQRSLDFARMSDAVNYRYALSKIPANAKWGTRFDSEKYLCINNQRLTVWIVGVVKSTWFVGEGGAPAARVSVGVHLPFEDDLAALHDLHKRARPTPTKFADRAFASCFQSRRPKGSSELVNLPFERIYDATEKLRAKSKMSKLPHTKLGRGDYILLEAWVNRYKTAGDKKASGDWTDWMVSLELRELSVLFSTPEGYIDEEDAPPADIDDDL